MQIDESRTAQLGLPRLPRGQGAHGLCERPEEHREVGLTPTAPVHPQCAHIQAQHGGEAGEYHGNWEKAWLGRLWLVLRGQHRLEFGVPMDPLGFPGGSDVI